MKRVLILICLASAANAQAVFELDAAQSRAAFTLSDVLHTVHGVFKVKRGSIQFDAATGACSGEIVVDAASGDSGSGARDKRMHQNVLESQKFPEISFAPSKLRGTVNPSGESKVEIDGFFTIHGAAHPLTASAIVTITGGQMQAKAHFAVPYVAWNMKNPSTLFLKVGESVDIDLDSTGRVNWPH
ncbi:MAG TPA: YceI family protein [Bryobacteraceae bacterium]|nr:YceI family protein [Bryobacteraceae bacterium]